MTVSVGFPFLTLKDEIEAKRGNPGLSLFEGTDLIAFATGFWMMMLTKRAKYHKDSSALGDDDDGRVVASLPIILSLFIPPL